MGKIEVWLFAKHSEIAKCKLPIKNVYEMQYIRLQHVKSFSACFLTPLIYRTYGNLQIGDIEEVSDRLPINH